MTFRLMQELGVVQKAHGIVLEIYKVTCSFPGHEQYGLTSQLRRAATSIPTNICEGKGRRTDADLGRFLFIAKGSLHEVQYLLTLSHDLGYISKEVQDGLQRRLLEVERMLDGMLSSLRIFTPLTSRKRPQPDPKK